mgnify:CR=1 FL=1
MQVRFGSFLSAVSNKPNESEKAGHLSVDLPRSELHRQKREERVEAVSELDLKENSHLTPEQHFQREDIDHT